MHSISHTQVPNTFQLVQSDSPKHPSSHTQVLQYVPAQTLKFFNTSSVQSQLLVTLFRKIRSKSSNKNSAAPTKLHGHHYTTCMCYLQRVCHKVKLVLQMDMQCYKCCLACCYEASLFIAVSKDCMKIIFH